MAAADANRLLAALPRETYESIAPHLERMTLKNGVVLHKPGEDIHDLISRWIVSSRLP
jgi:hypothetical protein